jgi:hypothetical protein
MRPPGGVFVLLLALFVPAHAQNAGAGTSSAPRTDAVVSYDSHRIFEFHSGFWVNLHHFLYEEASVRAKDVHTQPEQQSDADIRARLSISERQSWDDAVAYYQTNLVHRDLLRDDGMLAIKNRLEDSENESSLRASGLDPSLLTVLEKAAPVYRAHWWLDHERGNRSWIAQVTPLVDRYGEILMKNLAAAYDTPWPNSPVRVDVCAYANWAGAYTSLTPTRVTASSLDPRDRNVAGLEILFHESSHALIEKVSDLIDREAEALKKNLPQPGLWHAVLFFTAGYEVQLLIPDYTQYADANGLWTRAWPAYRAAMVKDWQPHLEGKVTLAASVSRLVADVAVSAPSDPPKSPASH